MARERPASRLDDPDWLEIGGAHGRLLEKIADAGWRVVYIAPEERHLDAWPELPVWAYSIGLYRTHRHPELVTFGVDYESATAILGRLAHQVAEGRAFEPGIHRDALRGTHSRCAIVSVSAAWHASLFGLALWFYDETFPVVQVVWPDDDERLPWEEGFDETLREQQPRLDEPPRLVWWESPP